MDNCPKCGAGYMYHHVNYGGPVWECGSWDRPGLPFFQYPQCRIAELENELTRFREQQVTINAYADRFTDAESELKHVREQQDELRQELTDAKAFIEHLQQRYSPFENDPFVVVAQAFAELWPNAPFPRVQIVEGLHDTDDAKWAETLVLDDDGGILVSIDVKAPMHGAVELLAHELAHVACEHLGLRGEDDHGPHWEECFAALHEKFNAEAAKEAGGDDG